MTAVASRDLRNHTASVLRRVAAGDTVTITVNGEPVAELRSAARNRRPSLTREETLELLEHHQADPLLRDDLAALGDDTDQLGPIR